MAGVLKKSNTFPPFWLKINTFMVDFGQPADHPTYMCTICLKDTMKSHYKLSLPGGLMFLFGLAHL